MTRGPDWLKDDWSTMARLVRFGIGRQVSTSGHSTVNCALDSLVPFRLQPAIKRSGANRLLDLELRL
jgi:hypothetical protein